MATATFLTARYDVMGKVYRLTLVLCALSSTGQFTTEDCIYFPNNEVWRWNVDEYPHPIRTPRFCGRFARSFVCDPDFIIRKHEADELDSLIQGIRNETRCICGSCSKVNGPRGITIGVALMRNMFLPPSTEPRKTVKDFAERLRKKWNLGNCDDDILLLISTRDSMSYTDVGPAVSAVFPKEVAEQIYLESRGHFTSGYYYQGLQTMIQSYSEMLHRLHKNNMLATFPTGQSGSGSSVGLIVGLVIGACALVAIIGSGLFFLKRRGRDSFLLYWIQKKGFTIERTRRGWRKCTRKTTKIVPNGSSQPVTSPTQISTIPEANESDNDSSTGNEPSDSTGGSDRGQGEGDSETEDYEHEIPLHLEILKASQFYVNTTSSLFEDCHSEPSTTDDNDSSDRQSVNVFDVVVVQSSSDSESVLKNSV